MYCLDCFWSLFCLCCTYQRHVFWVFLLLLLGLRTGENTQNEWPDNLSYTSSGAPKWTQPTREAFVFVRFVTTARKIYFITSNIHIEIPCRTPHEEHKYITYISSLHFGTHKYSFTTLTWTFRFVPLLGWTLTRRLAVYTLLRYAQTNLPRSSIFSQFSRFIHTMDSVGTKTQKPIQTTTTGMMNIQIFLWSDNKSWCGDARQLSTSNARWKQT